MANLLFDQEFWIEKICPTMQPTPRGLAKHLLFDRKVSNCNRLIAK